VADAQERHLKARHHYVGSPPETGGRHGSAVPKDAARTAGLGVI
jgi:hypothetical protein